MTFKSYLEHPLFQIPGAVLKLPGYVMRRPPLLVGVIIILLLVGGYLAGYRIGPGLSLMKVGTVVLTDLPQGATVYIDEALHKTTKTETLQIPLLPGTHTILVGTEGLSPEYYPWYELVTVPSGGEQRVRPMLIEKSAKETTLHDLDMERGELLIKETKLPTKEAPLLAYNGCVRVYVQNGRLIAEPGIENTCAVPEFLCSDGSCEPTVLLSPPETLRTVIPFPGRDDAVVLALGKAIYALELDPREPQFFAPILREHLPEVAIWSDSAIVVKEFGAVFTISF